jgi:hypothetical protein
MKTKLLALVFVAGSSLFAGSRFYVGIGVGGYGPGYYAPPPPPVVAYAPPYPGPGYTWVDGYYYPVGPRYVWHRGYWARPPYARSYWVRPRYYGPRHYPGYWRRW